MKARISLVALLVAAAPADAFVTRVSPTSTLTNGADASILCPSGLPLGGGFDTASFGVFRARGSGVIESDTPGEPIPRWAVHVLNSFGTPEDSRFAAVCGSLPGLVYAFEGTTQPAGGGSSDSVACPIGTVAIGGGGLTTANGIDSRLRSSAPTFADSPFGNDLSDQPDGEAVLPRGWDVGYDNLGAVASSGIVFVACADWDDVHPIVASETVAGGASTVAVAECPAGTAAVAGGFDAAQRAGLRLAASSPLFPGFILRESIFDVDGSTTEDAEAWRVVVHNDSLLAKTFQVVAMCVPEPATSAGAAVACAALVALWRRRFCSATRR